MKNLSRRCFIKRTFYSVGCLATGVKPVHASVSPENNPEMTGLLLSWQKKAREAFHKQEYGKSVGFYKKLINKAPGEIAYYDGIKKSLEKLGKHEEIVAYYKYGIEKNPQRVELKCPQKVGLVKHYPIIERVRYFTGLFPFNRDFILLLL